MSVDGVLGKERDTGQQRKGGSSGGLVTWRLAWEILNRQVFEVLRTFSVPLEQFCVPKPEVGVSPV